MQCHDINFSLQLPQQILPVYTSTQYTNIQQAP